MKTLQVTLLCKTFNIVTGTGVFSKKKIDRGTEILIEHSVIKDNWDILDLGCGKGGCLKKWYKSNKVGYYVGIDISSNSLIDAQNRLNKINYISLSVHLVLYLYY